MRIPTRWILIGGIFLVACTSQSGAKPVVLDSRPAVPANPVSGTVAPTPAPTATATRIQVSPSVVATPVSTETEAAPTEISPTEAVSSTATLPPENWKDFPVVPNISPKVVEIYQRGLELGNNPKAFSKIGDCGSTPAWFLGDFDRGPKFYSLGEYTGLEQVIQEYQGSYARTSLAAKSGFNVSSILSPFWADAQQCQAGETPLACEIRVHRPIAAFIMLGTNDVFHPESFEPGLRKIIEYLIDNGVIPILSTKADNLEGDESINATITALALEYEVPLLNYWRALQSLPDQGLQADQAHITYGQNQFDDPKEMERGWPVRNLTALQALDALWQALNQQP